MKKTNIQMLVRLNYPRFAEYFEWLLSHDLLLVVKAQTGENEENKNGPYSGEKFALSPKGIEAYHRFVGWVRETMEDVEL